MPQSSGRAVRADRIRTLTAPVHPAGEIHVYTDGAYDAARDIGGWAAVILEGKKVRELGGRENGTTVNRMELRAPLEALLSIAGTKKPVCIRSDSLYVINTLTKWADKWEKRRWIKEDGKPPKNLELIQAIRILSKTFKGGVRWEYTPGHAGVSGNERADELSEAFIRKIPELIQGNIADHPYDFDNLMKPSLKPKYYPIRKRAKND